MLFGLVDRDHALKLLSYLPYDIEEIDQEINYISKKLGVTKEYMEEVINRPPKWYVDYDNNMKLLGLMYDTYRCLSGKHKTSNF